MIFSIKKALETLIYGPPPYVHFLRTFYFWPSEKNKKIYKAHSVQKIHTSSVSTKQLRKNRVLRFPQGTFFKNHYLNKF